MNHCAYVHARPNTENAAGIFYVGKGSARRANGFEKASGNRFYRNIVAKHGKENILVGKIECSSERNAFDLEIGLIKTLRRMGVQLANATDGGEGASGLIVSAETKKVHSRNSLQRWRDPDFRKKVVAAQIKAQQNVVLTDKKLKSSRANATLAHAKLLDPEVRAAAALKNSLASKAMWSGAAFKARMSDSQKARWTPERRAAKSAVMKGRIRMTDGKVERVVSRDEAARLLDSGWVKGRGPNSPSKRTQTTNQFKE